MKLPPNDATSDTLNQFSQNGFDLNKVMEIEFFIVIPDEILGLKMATEIESIGFNTSVEYDAETNEWTCYCGVNLIPQYLVIVGIEKKLMSKAKEYGGYLDGFGSYGN
jgi:hypothetical protein